MKIGIATDHRGVLIKKKLIDFLEKNGYEVINYGVDSSESVDYPDYAILLGEKVAQKDVEVGVLICGTGIGMAIACNKVKGVRCAKVDNNCEAELAKTHNDANVISLSSFMSLRKQKKLLETFLKSTFSNDERHIRRIKKITEYENAR